MRIRRIDIRKIGIAVVGLAIGIIIAATIAATSAGTKETIPDKVNAMEESATSVTITKMQGTEPEVINLLYFKTDEAAELPEIQHPDQEDIEMLAKLIWGEARGVKSKTQQAAVVWCVLNRVDSTGYACGGTIEHVVTFKNQFQGYDASFPATDEFKAIAEDVLTRWYAEKAGYINTGRVLPLEYQWFEGNGSTNTFRNAYTNGTKWDWSLESPYEN